MLKTFHHGGRIGDLFYALYTMKALGGGRLVVSDFHQGNWDATIIRSLISFLEYQDYIDSAKESIYFDFLPQMTGDKRFVNLHNAERDYNPEAFPEWDGNPWPSNCNIAKRYATHFGIKWKPGSVWLKAPKTKDVDVVFHAPRRRVIDAVQLDRVLTILQGEDLKILVITNPQERDEWYPPMTYNSFIHYLMTDSYLEIADYINSAAVFFGAVSSCHACAEGLGKPRYVQAAPDCYNVNPTAFINDWPIDRVVEAIMEEIYAKKRQKN